MTSQPPAASPFTLTLKQIHFADEDVRREYRPNMVDRSSQSRPKEVPTGPRSNLGSWVWRKELNPADGREHIMTADPRRVGQKRSAALDSPVPESAARKVPRLETASDNVANGAATPVMASADEDVFSTRSGASPLSRFERPPVLSRTGSVELSRHSSPAAHHSTPSALTETRKVDKSAFAMTIPMEQLLEKSSDLGAARQKLVIAQNDYDQMIGLHESLTEQTAVFPAVQEQLEEEKIFIEAGLQQAHEAYDRLETELTNQISLAFSTAAMQCEDSASRVLRLEAENSRLQKDFQMQSRTLESQHKDIEDLKSQFKQLSQNSRKPDMDRKQTEEIVEEKLAWDRTARVNLESDVKDKLAKALHLMEDWKNTSAKKSASTDQKVEDARKQIGANERNVHQLETDLKEQSKKLEHAKSILPNLQTSVANLFAKDREAVQRHKACSNRISELETTVNKISKAAEQKEAEHANLSSSTAVPNNHDAGGIANLASNGEVEKQTASRDEIEELKADVKAIYEYLRARDEAFSKDSDAIRQELQTEFERVGEELNNWSSRIDILEKEAENMKHAAAPSMNDESIASLRAQVEALEDAQKQQHITVEALQTSVPERQSSERHASNTLNDAKVQELVDKHDAQTNVTQRLQEQLNAFHGRLDPMAAHTNQRFNQLSARQSATNSPRVGADVLPNARTATPPQGQQSPMTARPNETQQLRADFQQLRTSFQDLQVRHNELITSMNANNKEVRSRYTGHQDQLTKCKSDTEKAREKADSAHALAEENRRAMTEVETKLASRGQELVDIMIRLAALEDTKMKVEAAMSALIDAENGHRVSREATQRLEALSREMNARLDNGEKRQDDMNTRLNTLEDLDISDALHTIEERLTGQSTGIRFSVVHDAITNIEASLGHSKTDFEAMENELWQLTAEESPKAT